MPDSPNVQSPKSTNPNGKRWKKDGETDIFEKKFAQKQIYHLYNFMSPRSYPNFGGKRPSYPTHSGPSLRLCGGSHLASFDERCCGTGTRHRAKSGDSIVTSSAKFNCFLGRWRVIHIFLRCDYGTSILSYIYNICISMWHLWNDIICVSCKRCRHVQM